MPRWAAANDPDGTRMESWTRGLSAALAGSDGLLVDGRALAWENERFADPVHVLYPHHTPLTEFAADAMAAHTWVPRGPALVAGD